MLSGLRKRDGALVGADVTVAVYDADVVAAAERGRRGRDIPLNVEVLQSPGANEHLPPQTQPNLRYEYGYNTSSNNRNYSVSDIAALREAAAGRPGGVQDIVNEQGQKIGEHYFLTSDVQVPRDDYERGPGGSMARSRHGELMMDTIRPLDGAVPMPEGIEEHFAGVAEVQERHARGGDIAQEWRRAHVNSRGEYVGDAEREVAPMSLDEAARRDENANAMESPMGLVRGFGGSERTQWANAPAQDAPSSPPSVLDRLKGLLPDRDDRGSDRSMDY